MRFHRARASAKRATIFGLACLVVLVVYAGWVTDGFQQFDWHSFSHWAAGEKP